MADLATFFTVSIIAGCVSGAGGEWAWIWESLCVFLETIVGLKNDLEIIDALVEHDTVWQLRQHNDVVEIDILHQDPESST